ncbi:MAG: hypothetical protein OXD54_13110 [Candidatus Poribacteria bacterium]|nr:hypothetical protein [Candidatus Poribacteria bacterium]
MRFNIKCLYSVLLTIFSISLILTAGFITGCGDEGESASEMMNGNGDDMTDPDPVTPDPVEQPTDPDPAPMVSFKDDINPILEQTCALGGCHDAVAQGGLNLTSYDNFKNGGNGGAAFVAEDGENSLVVKRIDGSQPPQMPPVGPPLNADDIQLFIDWIDEGAENN